MASSVDELVNQMIPSVGSQGRVDVSTSDDTGPFVGYPCSSCCSCLECVAVVLARWFSWCWWLVGLFHATRVSKRKKVETLGERRESKFKAVVAWRTDYWVKLPLVSFFRHKCITPFSHHINFSNTPQQNARHGQGFFSRG
jgi:hypothetical protein